jgi:hypothetical protein
MLATGLVNVRTMIEATAIVGLMLLVAFVAPVPVDENGEPVS